MNCILLRRIKYHRRPEKFLPFEGQWGIVTRKQVVERFVGTGRLTTKGLHGLWLFVRSGMVWQLINQILMGGCGGEGSSQVVQRSKGLWVY
jgi:hypothetical protein